jgi:hypothetical protein
MNTYPIPNEWYHIIWVTICLILITIGECWIRLAFLQKVITTALGPYRWVLTIFKVLGWLSFSVLILVWGIYGHWVAPEKKGEGTTDNTTPPTTPPTDTKP